MTAEARILILSWAGGGNVPPAINLGARLALAGHRTRLLGWAEQAHDAAAAGLEFAAYPSVPPWPAGTQLESRWEDQVIPALWGPATRDDVIAAAAEFDPDVMVVDCMIKAGLQAVPVIGRPAVAIVHLPYYAFMQEWLADDAEREERTRLFGACNSVLSVMPPGLDKSDGLASNASYVGPIGSPLPPEPLARADEELLDSRGDPWVLLTLSTTVQGQEQALPPIIEALSGLPVRVLLTLGGVVSPTAVPSASNLTVRGYLAHDVVMPRMAAVVCHGGMSSVTTSLAHGLPMVCIPQGRDQFENAARVEASGAGRAVAADAPVSDMATAVRDVLDNPTYRSTANDFAKVIADLGYGRAAAEIVERLVGLAG